jgi:hypothetical protein
MSSNETDTELPERAVLPKARIASDQRRLATVLVLLLVGIDATFYHPGGWNQYARLAATVAFVEPGTPYTGTFRIDALRTDGSRLGTEDWAQINGAFYSNKAPGVSFLGVIPYFVLYHAERAAGLDPKASRLTAFNIWTLNLWLSVFWNAVAALTLLRRLPRLGVHSQDGAALVALVYACGTLVLPYGCSSWGHPTAAAFITLGLLNLAEDTRRQTAIAGFWLGMAALTEYLAAVSLFLAAVYVLSGPDRGERLWKLIAGSAAPVAALLLYQELAFGNYFTTAASLSNPVFLQPGKAAGLFGIPRAANLLNLLFRPERGFFPQMPVLLFSFAGAAAWFRAGRRAFLGLLVANIVVYVLSISALDAYDGGVTTSRRYLIIALPSLCMLLPDFRRFGWRPAFVALFAVSAANMFVLAATSTMVGGESPLTESAYPDMLGGRLSLNPWLGMRLGEGGPVVTIVIAAAYAAGLAWLLWTTLTRRSTTTYNTDRDGTAIEQAV